MKFKRLFIYILIFVFIMSGTICFANETVTPDIKISEATPSSANLNIFSDAAILIDSNSGKTLYEKNSTKKVFPASTTKILTAILAIENIENLQETTTVNYSAISVIPSGYSSAYLSEGEVISLEYVLQAFLIHSANEAGNVLAEYVSGSIEKFVELMNQKLEEIGCKNTHFVNTNGIHDENHYTTAEDMAIIARYCMKNQKFREIVAMKSCTIPKTNKSDERYYKNTNDLVNPSSEYYLEACIGIKTGYTTPAQNCLISACNKNGLELIAVVLGAPRINSGKSTRNLDSIELYNYGYKNYAYKKIVSEGNTIYNLKIKNGTKETKDLDLIIQNDINTLVSTNNENITYSINLNDNLSAPISANTVLGTITYSSEGIEYTENLVASHDVYKSNFFIFIIGLILALILIILINMINIRLKVKRKKKIIRRH